MAARRGETMESNASHLFARLSVADVGSRPVERARGKASQCKLNRGVKAEGTETWRDRQPSQYLDSTEKHSL